MSESETVMHPSHSHSFVLRNACREPVPRVITFLYDTLLFIIEGSKLACDTGGHFTNYPTWPLPRTNPNVDILNNSLNYYALADLILYRLSVNINHITLCLQTF